ncbi:MAG: hypothetical protein JNJ99_02560, partial [Crocinitomicaceae bacterium]|nr:hypothetical protein [Crocinitomicaceae bacterium]
NLRDAFLLDSSIYPKPEGITFLEDNSMVITNEGVDGNATLLLLKNAQ